MSYQLRKNASLKKVAYHTFHLARRKLKAWERSAKAIHEEDSPARYSAMIQERSHIYNAYSEMRELAQHLARLAGVELPDELVS